MNAAVALVPNDSIYRCTACLYDAIASLGRRIMQYWMMRLFLTSREEPPLFKLMQADKQPSPRHEYLLKVLSSDIRFEHRNRWYAYKFFQVLEDRYIAAVIGKEKTVTIASSPEERFKSKDVPDWKTANVLIDTSGDADGQKVAMHHEDTVGKPLAVWHSLIDHINAQHVREEWLISANAITQEREFWEAVSEFKGRISEMDLVFVTPNIWGAKNETDNALRELHDTNNAQTVEVRMKNPDGKLQPDSNRIRESVEYIAKGGGSVQLKQAKAVLYNSEDNITTKSDDADMPVQEAEFNALLALVRRILG